MNYKRIYSQIIKNRLANPLPESEYGQKHHILPKSLYPQYKNTKANIVKLTYREHYICHWLLTKIRPCQEMYNAFWRMNCCQNNLYFNSYAYSEIRQKIINLKLGSHLSEETKKKMSESLTGRKFSEEHCQKISNANKNRVVTDETKKKISDGNKGKKLSEETKKKISEKGKGRIVTEQTKQKLSVANKGKNTGKVSPLKGKKLSEETKKKISEAKKGSVPWNKGKNTTPITDEVKQKLREKMNNKRWINNGCKQMYIEVNSELPEGFIFGRIKNNKEK